VKVDDQALRLKRMHELKENLATHQKTGGKTNGLAKVVIDEKRIADWQTEVFLKFVVDHMDNNHKRKPLNLVDKPRPQDEFIKVAPYDK